MHTGDHDLRVSARTYRLTAGPTDDDDDGPPWTFSGIAVAAGDILHMDDGTRVLFTADELKRAAETQAGEPLTKDHPEDDAGRPKYPPDVDETFGTVPKAGWVPDADGVGYEATTHDEEIAAGMRGGSFDVSVHPFFDVEDYDGPEADVVATNITFGDLSVVSKGDSPSNTAQWGPNQALASVSASDELVDALPEPDNDGATEGLIASTVRGTLRALGVNSDDLETVSASDEEAESSTGGSGDSADMEHDDIITTLTDEHGFSEEALEAMPEDDLERLGETLVESDDGGSSTDTPDDGSGGTDDGGRTLADMTVDDLADGLEDRGFVTEENASDFVQEAQARASKADKVEAIITQSDDYDADDRDDLMASADSLVEREYDRLTGEPAAQLPGAAGLAASAGERPAPEEATADVAIGLADVEEEDE